jgi:ATP-dependent DNA helicase RecG
MGNQTTEKLLRGGENERIAFVRFTNSLEAVGKAVCALLNSLGGSVLVGVTDSGNPSGSLSKAQADQVRGFLHESIAPHALFTVSVDDVQGGSVLVVDVPAGQDVPYVFDGTVYVRSRSRTARANAKAIRTMIEKRATETDRWERRLTPGLEIGDMSPTLIRRTVENATNKRGFVFQNPKDIASVLSDLGLMRYGQLTNGADVLFDERVAIRHPQTRLRAVRYETDKGGSYLDDQLFEGSAFSLLERAMAFVRRSTSVVASFPSESLIRDVKPQYPFNAIREGLVNALVHRDYASYSGSVSVYIYPNRIEIWNSGSLPEGIRERDLRRESHRSVLVNPDISHIFYLHQLMERVGRGTYMIVKECEQMGAQTPSWRQQGGGVQLTIYASTGADVLVKALNERQIAALSELGKRQSIRSAEYAERFGGSVTERQVRRDLSELDELGFLKREGSGPSTVYVRTAKQLESGHPDMSMSGQDPDTK